MKTIPKTATVEKAYGVDLAEPIKFSYSYDELEKTDEIPAKEMPDADDLRSFVNQRRNAAARSKAQNEALTAAGITKPTLEDPAEQFKQMVRVLVAAGKSQEVAEQIAKNALGQ
jgi:hypothetical protein